MGSSLQVPSDLISCLVLECHAAMPMWKIVENSGKWLKWTVEASHAQILAVETLPQLSLV